MKKVEEVRLNIGGKQYMAVSTQLDHCKGCAFSKRKEPCRGEKLKCWDGHVWKEVKMRSKVHIVKVLDKEFHDCRHGDKTFLIVPDMDYTLHGLLELQKVQDDGSFSGDYCRFIIVYKQETGGLIEGMCCLGIKKVE